MSNYYQDIAMLYFLQEIAFGGWVVEQGEPGYVPDRQILCNILTYSIVRIIMHLICEVRYLVRCK